MGFLEVLTLLFVVLKLTAYIDWSWWQVTAPMWVGYPVIFLGAYVLMSLKFFRR